MDEKEAQAKLEAQMALKKKHDEELESFKATGDLGVLKAWAKMGSGYRTLHPAKGTGRHGATILVVPADRGRAQTNGSAGIHDIRSVIT